MSEDLDRAREAIEREDIDAAVALLLPLAQSGDVEGQFLLGSCLGAVDLLPLADAIGWLRRAAGAGHAAATYELALFRGEDGDGVVHWGAPTTVESAALLLRAGALGSAAAQYDLGALHATGDWAGPMDAAVARDWYRRAAEQGHAGARGNLGGMLLDGEGGAVDVAEGLRWLEEAAAQGDPGALERLARER